MTRMPAAEAKTAFGRLIDVAREARSRKTDVS